MAISPVAVAVNRNNTIDSLLIVTLLGAVWCVPRAVERSSLAWLASDADVVASMDVDLSTNLESFLLLIAGHSDGATARG